MVQHFWILMLMTEPLKKSWIRIHSRGRNENPPILSSVELCEIVELVLRLRKAQQSASSIRLSPNLVTDRYRGIYWGISSLIEVLN